MDTPRSIRIQSKKIDSDYETLKAPADAVRVTFEQLSIMLSSGINVVDALDILANSSGNNPGLEIALGQVSQDIQSGNTLSKSLTRFPRIFPKLIVELTRAGEETGRLALILGQATEWLSKQNSLKRKLVGALSYPVVVAVVAAVVNLLVLNFSLPQMEEMLVSLQVQTPLLTKIVFGFGHIVANPYSLCFMAISVVLLWGYGPRFITDQHRLVIFRMLHQLPVVGPLIQATALARIASTLQICLDVNLSILKALRLTLTASGNPAYSVVQTRILDYVRDGDSLASAFSHYPDLFPRVFCQSLEVGEESGQLSTSLECLGRLLEMEVDVRVDLIGNIVEPLLLGCCAIFVGIFVMATMLPLQEFLSQLMA